MVSGATFGMETKMLTLKQRDDYAIEAIKGVLKSDACVRYAEIVTCVKYHLSEEELKEVIEEVRKLITHINYVFL